MDARIHVRSSPLLSTMPERLVPDTLGDAETCRGPSRQRRSQWVHGHDHGPLEVQAARAHQHFPNTAFVQKVLLSSTWQMVKISDDTRGRL